MRKHGTQRFNAPSGLSSSSEWRSINRDAMMQLYTAFNTDSMAPSCVRAIENRLLSSGILFTTADYSTRASDEFQAHINLHFVNFVRSALVHICVCGWCFFVVDKDTPRVIPFGMADVRFRSDPEAFKVEMAIFKPGESKPASNVYCITDTCVDYQGNIESIMAGYIRTRSLHEAFMRNTLQADRINACPPIYTMTQTDQVFDERDIMSTGDVEDLRARRLDGGALVGSNMNARARINVSAHDYNESVVRRLNTRSAESLRSEKMDAGTGLAHFDSEMAEVRQPVIPLPLDARVAPVPRATAPANIVTVMKHFETLACVAFGVNSESVGADRSGGHVGAQTLDRINVVTSETTLKWARLFEPTLVQIFKLVWGGDEQITVVFPSTLPAATIERLYATRVLSHNAYVGYIGQTIQMPRSAFEKTDHRGEEPPSRQGAGAQKTTA